MKLKRILLTLLMSGIYVIYSFGANPITDLDLGKTGAIDPKATIWLIHENEIWYYTLISGSNNPPLTTDKCEQFNGTITGATENPIVIAALSPVQRRATLVFSGIVSINPINGGTAISIYENAKIELIGKTTESKLIATGVKYPTNVGNSAISNEGDMRISSGIVVTESSSAAAFYNRKGTLAITNGTLEATGHNGYGIETGFNEANSIILSGNAIVKVTGYPRIYANGIGDAQGFALGKEGELRIKDNAKLIAVGKETTDHNSYGIAVNGNLYIEGGHGIATGGMVTYSNPINQGFSSTGIFSGIYAKINITGGKIEASGTSCGISYCGELNISGGTVHASTETGRAGIHGACNSSTFKVEGDAQITAIGGVNDDFSAGISLGGFSSVTFTGGTISAYGRSAAESYGIYHSVEALTCQNVNLALFGETAGISPFNPTYTDQVFIGSFLDIALLEGQTFKDRSNYVLSSSDISYNLSCEKDLYGASHFATLLPENDYSLTRKAEGTDILQIATFADCSAPDGLGKDPNFKTFTVKENAITSYKDLRDYTLCDITGITEPLKLSFDESIGSWSYQKSESEGYIYFDGVLKGNATQPIIVTKGTDQQKLIFRDLQVDCSSLAYPLLDDAFTLEANNKLLLEVEDGCIAVLKGNEAIAIDKESSLYVTPSKTGQLNLLGKWNAFSTSGNIRGLLQWMWPSYSEENPDITPPSPESVEIKQGDATRQFDTKDGFYNIAANVNEKVTVYANGIRQHSGDDTEFFYDDQENYTSKTFYVLKDFSEDPDEPFKERTITLQVKGNGELEANYFIKGQNSDTEPIAQTVKAGGVAPNPVTVNVKSLQSFKIKATPGKDASLDYIIIRFDDRPEDKVNIEADKEYGYDIPFLSAAITAYFHTGTLYVDENTPLIGGTNEEEEVEHVNISGVGTSGNPVEKEVGNVKVTTQEGTTTIDDDSNVILNLSGTSNLGKLINKGTVIIKKIKDKATLEVTEVVNKGTFTDETGVITEVKDDASNTLLLLDGSTGDEVEEGQKATLTAKATVSEGATVTFLWQFLNEAESKWTNVPEASTKAQMRSVRLRASTNSREDKYETGILTKDAPLQYRCLITTVTPANEAEGTPPISTTLTTYTEVTIKSDPGTNPDPDPTPTPDPGYTW